MKDPIEEFEKLDQKLNEAFGDFLKNIGKNVASNLTKNKQGYKTASNIISQHQSDVESGAECKIFGTLPNNLFWSATGALGAYFGKNRNHVADIGDLNISKRELRCYDLKKDPKKIAWLFANDAKFEAEKIWGKPGKIYFKGKWMAGTFKGIFVQPSTFVGGEFKGRHLPPQVEPVQQIQPQTPTPSTIIPATMLTPITRAKKSLSEAKLSIKSIIEFAINV